MSEANAIVVVLGRHGQVARGWTIQLGASARVFGRNDLDLNVPHALAEQLSKLADGVPIRAVINAAAYTHVDQAEDHREECHRINAEAPAVLATWCRERDLPFMHYSSDYVFSGEGEQPWREEDATDPRGVYGLSKRDGELAIAAAGGKFLIFRTSWVYDAGGKNFFNTMLSLSQTRDTLKIVADQVGAPTYAPHLVEWSWAALREALARPQFPSGVYHLCPQGFVSWFHFAQAIFNNVAALDQKVPRLIPVPSADYPTRAIRPQNSRLSVAKFLRTFKVPLPQWPEGLAACIKEKYGG